MAMISYSGWEYLLIDVCNQFGGDKLLFEERIQWAMDNLPNLEQLYTDRIAAEQNLPADKKWKEAPLYAKAVMAIRKAQQGIPTGHMVAMDGVCSGIQVMSALTGCIAGARSTGLIDPGVRADAYSATTEAMNTILGGGLVVSRSDAKRALMTTLYGSKKTPKDLFGEDTPELAAFYQAVQTIAPGAWELLQDLLNSWQPYALSHEWKLPDGFDARVKVMNKKELRIEVDELLHATFSYEYYENQGQKKGISLPANAVHSFDAYVLRCMHRRCNYDRAQAEYVSNCIEMELIQRSLNMSATSQEFMTPKLAYYIEQYNRSGLADIVILPYLDQATVSLLSTEHLQWLANTLEGMLQYQPFELVTVHDAFASLCGNVNWVRWQYKEILADIADSRLLDDLLSQIHGIPGQFAKLSTNLGDLIRGSNYALS